MTSMVVHVFGLGRPEEPVLYEVVGLIALLSVVVPILYCKYWS
jgi:hypothetical protein